MDDEAEGVADNRLRVALPVAALAIGVVGGFRGAAPPGWALGLAAACVLLAIAVVDARTRMIPVIGVAAVAALVIGRAGFAGDLRAALLGGLAGFAVFGLLWVAARWTRPGPGPDPFGSGDVLLAAGIGAAVGWPAVLGTLFLGAVFGAVYAVWLVLARSGASTDAFPYGAFLCLAAIWVLLLGG